MPLNDFVVVLASPSTISLWLLRSEPSLVSALGTQVTKESLPCSRCPFLSKYTCRAVYIENIKPQWVCVSVCMRVGSFWLMDCSQQDSSVHGIFQARILEWVALFFSGGSSRSRDQTRLVSPVLAGGFFTTSATWDASVVNTYILTHSYCLSIGSTAESSFRGCVRTLQSPLPTNTQIKCLLNNKSILVEEINLWTSLLTAPNPPAHPANKLQDLTVLLHSVFRFWSLY